MNHWVMDYETLCNLFCGVFKHYKTEETKIFVIHKSKDDRKSFIDFLNQNIKNKEYHISFNGLEFDSQISHWFIDNQETILKTPIDELIKLIYNEAQDTIKRSNNKEFSKYPEWKMLISQIDVFKLNHWDNPAKRSSLKWIEYTMDWDNILDMPIPHNKEINSVEDINMIIKYCINDVLATKEIYNRSKSLIQLRMQLSKEYNINLFNASEPRISKELFGFYLSKELDIPKYELKKMRTFRSVIKLKNIILPYISFKTAEFKLLLERFKTVELNPLNMKGSFKYSVKYKGVKTNFGLGGVHGANNTGIYKPNEGEIIMSSDVVSFYPNLAIKNQWSPAHLPKKQFSELYEWFFEERKKINKKDPMNYVYKIILNSTYGLSNDKNSFLYDPEFTMRITVNGQLTLMMLYEMIMERIPEARAIMQNTDGIETIIPESAKKKYLEICKEWEELTQLNLEHDEYQQIIFGDVNNYIGVFKFVETDLTTWKEIKKENSHYLFKTLENKFFYAPIKCKGRFEFNNLALHKNKSKLVIPKAIYEYFINNILPEEYLKNNTNILDYCIGNKTNSGWQVKAEYIEDGKPMSNNQQKINRYYISNNGNKLIKVNKNDDRVIQLEAGPWMTTLFNNIELKSNWIDYNINFKYYKQAIEKEINNIIGLNNNQLNLFN
jgi:hypothetical protein